MKKINVGIIGCGNISDIYIKNFTSLFQNINLYAICDLDSTRTKAVVEKYGDIKIFNYEEIIKSPDIEIIVNLTTPQGHFSICKDILNGGKHAYVEKPLSLSVEEGKTLLQIANDNNLMIGCAPDTFLGAGIQTCRKIIDDGIIGDVIGATAFMLCHGHESWHPDPEFYYKKGGGPLFDMGPYYLTALVCLMGSVKSVMGMCSKSFDTRTISSSKKFGDIIDVEIPTHVNGLLKFENGAVGNIITSFDVWGSTTPRIEIYGKRGTVIVPDPNTFGGEILVKQSFDKEFKSFPLLNIYEENSRGIGVSDMADCIINGKNDNRANGQMACHILEIMHAIHNSSDSGRIIDLTTTCKRPKPLALNLINGFIN